MIRTLDYARHASSLRDGSRSGKVGCALFLAAISAFILWTYLLISDIWVEFSFSVLVYVPFIFMTAGFGFGAYGTRKHLQVFASDLAAVLLNLIGVPVLGLLLIVVRTLIAAKGC